MLIGAGNAGREGFMAVVPILALTGVAAIAAPMALGGWLLSSNVLQFKPERMDPIAGSADVLDQRPDPTRHVAAKTIVVGGSAARRLEPQGRSPRAAAEPLHLALADTLIDRRCCGSAVAGMFSSPPSTCRISFGSTQEAAHERRKK